jgi:hypothetical protein
LDSLSRSGARARDRPGLLGPFVIEAALGLAQPAASAVRGRHLRRQLIATALAELLVLFAIDRVGLGQDLARDLLVVAGGVLRGVGVHLGAVDRDQPDRHQAGPGAEREHLAEQTGQRRLVTLAKARDRAVIRPPVRGDHARRDVLHAAPPDAPRRPLPDRVGVEQQRDHHRRIVRRTAMPVSPVGRAERRQIQLRHGIDHKPRKVALGQPLAQARRQQKLPLTATPDEVPRHARNRQHRRGQTRSVQQPPWKATAKASLPPFHRFSTGEGADRMPADA